MDLGGNSHKIHFGKWCFEKLHIHNYKKKIRVGGVNFFTSKQELYYSGNFSLWTSNQSSLVKPNLKTYITPEHAGLKGFS